MRVTQRGRRALIATAMAAVVGGGGVAVGAAAFGPAVAEPSPVPAAAPVPPGAPASASYAAVVREVLPSAVLIRTASGLGSGVVLDTEGNIITNAHVAGDATSFEVQVAGQAEPRPARLAGTYPPDDLAVIRAGDPSPTVTGADGAPAGAGVVAVIPGGPAGQAGIRAGDVIRSFGATPTPESESLTQALASARPGQSVTLTIARGDQTLTTEVRLGELPGS
jgi:putative serine protease PepD